jgi:hypothetical protein
MGDRGVGITGGAQSGQRCRPSLRSPNESFDCRVGPVILGDALAHDRRFSPDLGRVVAVSRSERRARVLQLYWPELFVSTLDQLLQRSSYIDAMI